MSSEEDDGGSDSSEAAFSSEGIVTQATIASSVSVASLGVAQSAVGSAAGYSAASYSYSSSQTASSRWQLRKLSKLFKNRGNKTWLISIAGVLERMSREKALRNHTRKEILEIVREKGPIHLRGIMKRAELTPNSVKYHLFVLERFGLVVRKRVGNYLVFMAPEKSWKPGAIKSFVAKNRSRKKIMNYLLKNGESTISKISQAVRLHRSTVRYHLALLQKIHVVRIDRRGRSSVASLILAL